MTEALFQIGVKAVVRNDRGKILMVHIPHVDKPYWDLPGGRVQTGESFVDALNRELVEEIGVGAAREPAQLKSFQTTITIPVGADRVPLILMLYEVHIPDDAVIALNPSGPEKSYAWFVPQDAADKLRAKLAPEACTFIAQL